MSATGRSTLAWRSAAGLQTASRGKTGNFGGVESVPGTRNRPCWPWPTTTRRCSAGPTAAAMHYTLRPLGGGFGPLARCPPRRADGSPGTAGHLRSRRAARALWVGPTPAATRSRRRESAPNGTSETAQIVSPPSAAPAGPNDHSSPSSGSASTPRRRGRHWMHSYDAAPGPAFDTRFRVRTSILDSTPPAVGAVRLEGAAVQGRTVTMSVTARDALSGATAIWSFGDGTTEEGESLTKVYASPGVFTVRVTVTDSAGNATTVQRTVDVSHAGGRLAPCASVITPPRERDGRGGARPRSGHRSRSSRCRRRPATPRSRACSHGSRSATPFRATPRRAR